MRRSPFSFGSGSKAAEPTGSVAAIASKAAGEMAMQTSLRKIADRLNAKGVPAARYPSACDWSLFMANVTEDIAAFDALLSALETASSSQAD
jgi:hypothetical protein